MRRLGPIAGALALLVALLAGCGGGGGGESTAAATTEATEPAALAKAELIEQGDAICGEVNAAVGAAGSTSSGTGATVVQVAGLYGGMVERLKGLGPPREEAAGYSGFINTAEELAQAEDNVKLAYEREEAEALTEAAGEVSTALARFESEARQFGFEKCAEAPTAPSPGGAGSGEATGGEEENAGGVESEVEEAPEEEAEAAPEAPPVEEESAGGGAGVGGGEGGGAGGGGGSSGGIGPG